MKRQTNLYEKMVSYSVINKMYKVIKTNTKNKNKLYKFEQLYTINVTRVYNALKDKKYLPGRYNIFIISEPKHRLIMSQQIGDKLINHLVANIILIPVLEKSLIDTNIATRVNKGTHAGIKYVKKCLNDMKNDTIYALKFDISKYFYNINHDILVNMIKEHIKDKDALNIIYKIIKSTDCEYVNKDISKQKEKWISFIQNSNINIDEKQRKINEISKLPLYKEGKGLPIGNLTSQILAVFYLNKLDHFIKEELHIKYYVRYMDDGVILHHDKNYLKYCLKEIEKEIKLFDLELNKKTRIINVSKEGLDFLGFKFYKKNKIIMKVRNDTKKRYKKKIKLIEKGKINKLTARAIKSSYDGHFKWGNCYYINHRIKLKNF